jgi:hypothetical protein
MLGQCPTLRSSASASSACAPRTAASSPSRALLTREPASPTPSGAHSRPARRSLRLSLRMQVWHVVFMIGVKAMLNGTLAREADRERDRQRILAEFARDLRPADSRP